LTPDAVSSLCVLTDCRIRYAGYGGEDPPQKAGVRVRGINPTIAGCTFESNDYAIIVNSPATGQEITGNTFGHQSSYPVYLCGESIPHIMANNTFQARPDGRYNAIRVIDGVNDPPAQGNWRGLDLNADADSCWFENCHFRYGGQAGAAVVVAGSVSVFRLCFFEASSGDGLKWNSLETGEVEHCWFVSNQRGLVNERNLTSVTSCCFYYNTLYGLENRNCGYDLDARECWCDATGPRGAGQGSGDAVSSCVLFDPWSTVGCGDVIAIEDPEAYAVAPTRLMLGAPIPNPATDRVVCTVAIPSGGRVRLEIFDVSGRACRTLCDSEFRWGVYNLDFGREIQGIPGGVYLLRLQSGGMSATRKLIIAR